jgi:hypothetical protein
VEISAAAPNLERFGAAGRALDKVRDNGFPLVGTGNFMDRHC